VLRKIFLPKRIEVTGDWKKLHNEELHLLYSSPNTVWVIKSKRMRRLGHMACLGVRRGADRVLLGKLEGNRPVRIDGRIM
jgi:hypothetical protein